METYWDLEPKDRASLTDGEVKRYEAVELMQHGRTVPKEPTEPVYEDVPLHKTKCYSVQFADQYGNVQHSGFAFEHASQAEAFLALMPMRAESSYDLKCRVLYPLREGSIAVEELPSENGIAANTAALERNGSLRRAYESAKSAYDRARRECKECVADMWTDYGECRKKRDLHDRIAETLDEYMTLCHGEFPTAMTFLAKAFEQDAIAEAAEWLGKTAEWGLEDEQTTNAPGV